MTGANSTYTTTAPKNPPSVCARQYGTTFFQENLRYIASASVTAGFAWQPLTDAVV